MERLQKTSPSFSLTDEEKKELAELDSKYRAKIAEKELFLKEQICQSANRRQNRRCRVAAEATHLGDAAVTGGLRSQKRKVARWLREKSAGLALRLPWAGGLEDSRCTALQDRFRPFRLCTVLSTLRQIGIQEAEHVRATDRADAFLFLQLLDAAAEFFHLGPMHLGRKWCSA